jgi:FHS family glucose/mannose:H+ symporter-like MFS transporter
MSTFLSQSLGFSVVASSAAVGVFWAAVTIGRFAVGQLTLRYSAAAIIVALALASVVAVLLAAVVSEGAMVWVVIAALGLAFSSQWPLIVAFGSERYPASSGTVFALLVGSGGLGTTIIPLAMGTIGESSGLRAAMASPALAFLAIAAIIGVLAYRERRAAVEAGAMA